MRRPARYCALLIVLGACGDDLTAPTAPLLLGRWGASGDSRALLLGLRVGAELQLGCSSVGINRPVTLEPDGRFAFRGRLHPSTLTTRKSVAQVNGRVQGERVDLTLDVLGDGVPAWTITLRQGVDPAFEDLPPVCPL